MPYDGLFTHAMVKELHETLAGGHINKVQQPYQDEIILVVRNQGKNHALLLSANAQFTRAQITQIPYQNPSVAPTFMMFLRRYLEGAKISEIQQVGNDRIVKVFVHTKNELGDPLTLSLTLEMMGCHSNLFLIDEGQQKILELIKHIPADLNRVRSLMPGATYILPPDQKKQNPFQFTGDLSIADNLEEAAQQIQKQFEGVSTPSALEAATYLKNGGKFAEWLSRFDEPQPQIVTTESKLVFAPFDWQTISGEKRSFETLSRMLDVYYAEQAERERAMQQAGSMTRVLKNELKRNQTKAKKLQKTIDEAKLSDQYKVKGELLTTYMTQVAPKQTEIDLPNYYDNDAPLTITLDPQKSPSQNAQAYFKRYRKAESALVHAQKQLALTEAEVNYLMSVQAQLEVASPADVTMIRQELVEGGYLRPQNKKQPHQRPAQPEQFKSTDGDLIEVGKNNLQNDQLSMKTAAKSDIWLHVQKLPGSHVIIHNDQPSDQTLIEAAQLAGYFSKARQSATVPVDYLPAGKLRKPNGSKPGYVIFEGQQTVFVTPTIELVNQLRVKK